MKGIKECGNCLHWRMKEDDDWGMCLNAMVDDLIEVVTHIPDEDGEDVDLIFHREFSCRGYDYMAVVQEKG